MNRTILIVICDFLLVSLLAFSTVDINKVAEEGVERRVQVEIATNQVPEAGQDLSAVMRLALEDERKQRDLLMGELSRARNEAAQRDAQLTEREKQARAYQQEIQEREKKAAQLQQDTARLQQEQTSLQKEQAALQQQFAAAQTNIQSLSRQLQASSTEALISKERLAALEAELKKRADEAAAMQKQISNLAQSNQMVLTERQQLATKLEVAEVEKRHASELAAKAQEQVKVEREERVKLSEGMKTLAAKSSELATEVRESRPLAPNTIFSEFVANRVQASLSAFRPGLIDTNRRKESQTVLATDGTNTYALCHVQDTPLALTSPGTEWESLTGTLSRDRVQTSVRSLGFHLQDPRIVMIPISAAEAKQFGSKAYRLASDPFKFQDAVLVGTREAYYGECRFQIDVTAPEYLRLDNSFIRGLFGQFNPSRGDLVFSRTGELLGVMANDTYCLVLRNFDAGASLQFGKDVRKQQPGTLLSLLASRVAALPLKLQ